MTWFVIHLRNGKSELVEGEEARDRAMQRKTPAAVSWGQPKIHRCSVCRRTGPWTDGWQGTRERVDGWCWVGTPRNAHAGRTVEKFCSSSCRVARYPEYPQGDRSAEWDERITLQSWEPVPDDKRWDSWESRREREHAFGAHRRFEMPLHEHRGNGWCRWCGGAILEHAGKNRGKRSARRTWHRAEHGERDCNHEWQLHTDRTAQWWFLAQRDGPGCADCGKDDGHWVADPAYSWHQPERQKGITWLAWSVRLEVDHETPLWKIPLLPADKPEWRRALFGPDNLKLRCERCHARKSAAEAAERAALRGQLRGSL